MLQFPHLSAPLWVTPEPSISTRSPVLSFSVEHMYRDASVLCLPDGRDDGVAHQELYHGFSGPKCAHPPALRARLNVPGCAFVRSSSWYAVERSQRVLTLYKSGLWT